MLRVLLVAAQKAMVNALVQTAEAARLEPVGLDLTPFALIRAVGEPDGGPVLAEAGDEAVIDVGADITSICVHERTVPRFVRILPSGGNDITLAVARALAVPEDVAERLKRGEAVEGGPSVEDASRVAAGRARNRRLTLVVAIAGAAVLALIVFLYVLQGFTESRLNKDLAAQNATNAQLQQQVNQLQHFATLRTQLQTEETLLSQALAGTVSWSGVLHDLSLVIPDRMWITSLTGSIAAPVQA